MLYRRQILLYNLIKFRPNIGKTMIQKLIFLFSKEYHDKSYDFFPYKYGPYSQTLQTDLDYLVSQGLISKSNDVYIIKSVINTMLSRTVSDYLSDLIAVHGNKTLTDIIRYTYNTYPVYARNSELMKEELQEFSPFSEIGSSFLCTIGYEGKSIDTYLYELIINNINCVIDVRYKAFSMKAEFRLKRLSSSCKLINVDYKHLPELGINTATRKEAKDKMLMFSDYSENLHHNAKHIDVIYDLISNGYRVALTCFEACHTDCHRHYIAEFLRRNYDSDIRILHI